MKKIAIAALCTLTFFSYSMEEVNSKEEAAAEQSEEGLNHSNEGQPSKCWNDIVKMMCPELSRPAMHSTLPTFPAYRYLAYKDGQDYENQRPAGSN